VSEKYNILPSAGLLLFPEDVEKDDWLHNPDPNEKEKQDCDIWNKRGMVNLGALAFLSIGILFLFIGYPVLYVCPIRRFWLILTICRTFVDRITKPEQGPCTHNALCIEGKQNEPTLANIRTGLIDPDTPKSAMSRTGAKGQKQNLVVCRGIC
jgi:hypothetical protein